MVYCYGSLAGQIVAQLVTILPAMQETWVWSLNQEDTLEKETATHSSILAWRISWTEEPGWLQSLGSQESDMIVQQNHHPGSREDKGLIR